MAVYVLELPSRIDRSSWVSWACYYFGFMFTAVRVGPDAMLADPMGLAILAASVIAFFVAVVLLQRHMRIALTSNSFGEPRRLVTSGAFKWTRNPIYVAFLMPLAALGYFSLVAAGTAAAAYLISMTLWVVSREEETLSQRFPEEFAAYCASTPRWFWRL